MSAPNGQTYDVPVKDGYYSFYETGRSLSLTRSSVTVEPPTSADAAAYWVQQHCPDHGAGILRQDSSSA